MKTKLIVKYLTLIFAAAIIMTTAITAAVPNYQNTPISNIPDTDVAPRETQGILDDAITDGSEALDGITGALNDAKNDIEDAADSIDNNGGRTVGIVFGILIAIALIILLIIMISKNDGKSNRKR